MKSVDEVLTALLDLAKRDRSAALRIEETTRDPHPVRALCRLSTELGYPLYEMDLIAEGEERYDQMKRSTNGGGANSPKLRAEDDYYELFLSRLRDYTK